MIDTHMNSQRLRQQAKDLQESVQDCIQGLKGELDTCPIPIPEAISNKQPLANENLVSSEGVSLGKQTTLMCRLYEQQS